MKKKSNGVFRARMNMRRYEQIDGEHYNSDFIASPVTNDVTIRVIMALMIMAGWASHIVDVKGAFLHGEFENNEELYFKVPQGFEQHYCPNQYVLRLLKTAYRLKQAAIMFWKELVKGMNYMGFRLS